MKSAKEAEIPTTCVDAFSVRVACDQLPKYIHSRRSVEWQYGWNPRVVGEDVDFGDLHRISILIWNRKP